MTSVFRRISGCFLLVVALSSMWPTTTVAQSIGGVSPVTQLSLLDANGKVLAVSDGGNMSPHTFRFAFGSTLVTLQVKSDLSDWYPGPVVYQDAHCQGIPYFLPTSVVPPFSPSAIVGPFHTLLIPLGLQSTPTTIQSAYDAPDGCTTLSPRVVDAVPSMPVVDLDMIYQRPFHFVATTMRATASPTPAGGGWTPSSAISTPVP